MSRPPRPPEQSVLGDGLWQRVLACGVVVAIVTVGVGLWAESSSRPWQSMIFVSLTCLQLGVALGLRPRLFTRQNPLLPLAILLSITLALAGLYVPLLQDLLGTVPLTAVEVALAVLVGVAGLAVARATGWIAARRRAPILARVTQ